MKKKNYLSFIGILMLIVVFSALSCEKDEKETTPNNQPPNCMITNPSDGSIFDQGDVISISVNATDEDGTIDELKIFLDDSELVAFSSTPYSYEWNANVSDFGEHKLKATAYDNSGSAATDEVSIIITQGSVCSGITEIDYGGQTYHTTEIGGQCWLKENLNYETGNSKCYENNPANCQTYGRLYDWETALTACPEGWHLPSDGEWKTLFGFADSEYEIGDPVWDGLAWRGFDVGKNLKATSGWGENYNGTDKYGFTALPGGVYDYIDNFFYIGEYGIWWSSTEGTDGMWSYDLGWDEDRVYRGTGFPFDFISVRCIKD